MKILDWLRRRFVKARMKSGAPAIKPSGPLREFVYLDEVSLRSLLTSQGKGLTEGTSEETISALQAQLSSSMSANAPLIAASEVKSSFQTSNSSSIQTSRKATVQSWFVELLSTEGIRLIKVIDGARSFSSTDELVAHSDCSVVARSNRLVRGELVEIRVRLSADPVFRLGTVVSEFLGMAEDYPEMLANGAAVSLKETIPVYKVLQRLLAGLIPIRAEAIDYVVTTIEKQDYVVRCDAIAQLGLNTRPLEIVGVTEHLAYWKDIRRVLFSSAEFTVLGRIARSDLQASWTPVKLAELFGHFDANLSDKISSISRDAFGQNKSAPTTNSSEECLMEALRIFRDSLLWLSEKQLDEDQCNEIDKLISTLGSKTYSASAQRGAFSALKSKLSDFIAVEIGADDELRLREQARSQVGLPLFPSLSKSSPILASASEPVPESADANLLDLEIVAIYW